MQGSTVNSQGSQKGKSANSKNNNLTTDHDQANDGGNDEQSRGQKKNGENQKKEKNTEEEKRNWDYFGNFKGNKMTVVFHAILSPHFKFEQSDGDRIVMRFGGPAFGDFNKNVVEVYPER